MKQIDRVLYVMDDSLEGMVALKKVLLMAGDRGWRLTLFSVIESIGSSARMLVACASHHELKARTLRKRRLQLEALISMITHEAPELAASVSFGNRAKEILQEYTQGRYDLLIKPCENNSTDKFLLKHCDESVWLLKPGDVTNAGEFIMTDLPQFVAEDRQ